MDRDRIVIELMKTFFIIVITFIFFGCMHAQTIKSKAMPQKNPTSFVFNFSIHTLKDSIISFFTPKNQSGDKDLEKIFYMMADPSHKIYIPFAAETNRNARFGKEYFMNNSDSNDIYLHPIIDSWPSQIYYKGNYKALDFRCAFIIKFNQIGDFSTELCIEDFRPRVLTGETEGISCHGPIAKETKVQPTTIEEYTILLVIAKKLGVKSMPALITPDSP